MSRAARALWEHIHDQVPLADAKRDTLTLDQFLDTWASLADYVIQTNQLPPQVDDLVKLGFELYATEDAAGKQSIDPIAFDRLFQKMNLGRPYAIMAYKLLTDVRSMNEQIQAWACLMIAFRMVRQHWMQVRSNRSFEL